MHLFIIANESEPIVGFVTDTLNKLGNPALVLLLLVLGFVIYYFMKQNKEKDKLIAAKDEKIQSLHKDALESTVNNLKIVYEISASIDNNDKRYREQEILMRDNNSFLKSIARSLNI